MVASRAEEGGQKTRGEASYIPAAGSPRNPLAHAVCAALTALLEGLPEAPLPTRVELRSIRARVARLYKIPLNASEADVAWENHPDEEIQE